MNSHDAFRHFSYRRADRIMNAFSNPSLTGPSGSNNVLFTVGSVVEIAWSTNATMVDLDLFQQLSDTPECIGCVDGPQPIATNLSSRSQSFLWTVDPVSLSLETSNVYFLTIHDSNKTFDEDIFAFSSGFMNLTSSVSINGTLPVTSTASEGTLSSIIVPVSTETQETRTKSRIIAPTTTSLSSVLSSSLPVRLVSNTTTAFLATTTTVIMSSSSTSAAVLSTSSTNPSSYTSPPFSTLLHSHVSLASPPRPTIPSSPSPPSPTSTSPPSLPAPTAAPIISKPVPTIAGVPQPVFISLLVVVFFLTLSSIILSLFLARRKKKRQRLRQIEAELLARDSWTEQALAKLKSPVSSISNEEIYELGGAEAKKKSIYELEVLRRKTAMCELPSNSRNTTQWPPLPPRK